MAQRAFSFVRRPHSTALFFFPFVLFLSIIRGELPRPSQAGIWEEFSGEKALTHVQRLVDFGPRPPGSDAIEKSRDYIDNQLRLSGWQVTRQSFTDNTPRGRVGFVNLIAHFPGQGNATASFLFCS